MTLLGIGTVAGFGTGVARLGAHRHARASELAEICVSAALRPRGGPTPAAVRAAVPPHLARQVSALCERAARQPAPAAFPGLSDTM
jgi:hypothetical protein